MSERPRESRVEQRREKPATVVVPIAANDDPSVAPPPGRLRRIGDAIAPWRPAITGVVAIAVLVLVWLAISKLIREVRYDDVISALHATPISAIVAAIVLTFLSFLSLTVYDYTAIRYIGRRVPLPLVALTAFCSYAVGNMAGFGPLTGGAIRYRFYSRMGFEPADVGRVVAFITVAFGLGLGGVTALGLVFNASEVAAPINLPPVLLTGLGVATLLGLVALVAYSAFGSGRVGFRGMAITLPGPGMMIAQFIGTLIDVTTSAAVLWVLLPANSVDLPAFVAVFAVAIGLGVASHVPAGLGVFEAVIVAVIGRTAPLDQILSALFLYRIIYYGLPLIVASALVATMEVRRAAAGPRASRLLRTGARLSPRVLSALTLTLGAVLILSGVTPAADERLDLLSNILPLPILESAHFIESVLGLCLIVIARGLAHRLDGAWWAAICIVGVSAVLSLLKALAITESIALTLLFCALFATRREFTRPASLLHQRLSPGWLLAMATVVICAVAVLFFVYSDVDYSHELWWQFEFSEEAPRSLRALLGVVIASGLIAGWSLLRPSKGKTGLPTAEEIRLATEIVAHQPHPDANLVRMGDKTLLFSEDGSAFIMFGRQAHSWVALFDPVGPRKAWPELVWQFVEMAHAAGGRAVFYQVQPQNLSLYADCGLRAYKLGEAAQVDLTQFDLKGAKRASLRHAHNRGARDGLSFDLLTPEEVTAEIDALQAVSNLWLSEHRAREKRFSLGAFDRTYVSGLPAAVIRREGRIVAFATLLTTNQKQEATVDLMRFAPDVPPGTMEYLFVCLLLRLKSEGYHWFDLGMAPLSGLAESPAAPFWHRMGRAVFEHGERFYNFNGLRAFKAKFQPEWQPRYLVMSGGASPALALTDVTVLISGGLKGVVGK
ncbi:bifunctional lysylphosphatidylglycerol flippase/synthetase MprF [Kaistia dalseonensis]|uniref:Phosphatidylglycerol lysyltransferase n=1 Tax=Kaistia dalseonensis TaxID=410840 RepID=A0ABU0H777_9HYPH|nr:bifunctional lysylphosphatidylglycerol flippase/synthetase MprF [Kaistia dalseonensis]MCX5495291.1 bifunctional lysylphosphatidylglycerol flippase/synthetase MprF [Kaistia dalseonensis]MDQ0437877.1 phosphatidylglycerol lysyltransferase [Kaistia dalseonensis]